MRAPFLFLLFSSGIAFAGVEIRDGKISADLNSQPIGQVVQEIKSQTDIRVSVELSVSNQTVSANFQNLPIAGGIKKILEGTGINYAVVASGDGEPQAIFIGNSEQPGAGPRRLDNRPPNPAGMVNPVAPVQQPPPTYRPTPPDEKTKQPPRPSAVEVPTGGGFVPQTESGQQEQQKTEEEQQENVPQEDKQPPEEDQE